MDRATIDRMQTRIARELALPARLAETPIGSQRQPLFLVRAAAGARNARRTIAGRDYTPDALDQMQSHGIMPSVVEHAIRTGSHRFDAASNTTSFHDRANQLTVVTGPQPTCVLAVSR